MLIRKDKNFISFFDPHNGTYMRTGILKDGKDTGQDPFMASFPELLDVGIMGHCIHGRQGLCLKAQVECYQDGLHANNPNMTVADFQSILKQCQGKTFQFALGGCGDPDQHENFAEILALCKEYNIVPNFTTSGLGLTPNLADLCQKYCGAVAVSWYRSPYTLKAIKMLLEAKVKTNIHYVLNRNTLDEALTRLKENSFPQGINAIIFLLHKPVGQGTLAKVLRLEDKNLQEFFQHATNHDFSFKIGFDSCTVPALIQESNTIDLDSIDTCEGARFSAYITPDLKLLPCSFDNQKQKWAVDLHQYSLKEAWDSPVFEDFRNNFRTACPNCQKRNYCLGGCPICEEIILCPSKKARNLEKESN